MSLKEEIDNIIGVKDFTPLILKEIEKRIDSVKTMLPGGNYEIDLKYLLVEGIKQEILK